MACKPCVRACSGCNGRDGELLEFCRCSEVQWHRKCLAQHRCSPENFWKSDRCATCEEVYTYEEGHAPTVIQKTYLAFLVWLDVSFAAACLWGASYLIGRAIKHDDARYAGDQKWWWWRTAVGNGSDPTTSHHTTLVYTTLGAIMMFFVVGIIVSVVFLMMLIFGAPSSGCGPDPTIICYNNAPPPPTTVMTCGDKVCHGACACVGCVACSYFVGTSITERRRDRRAWFEATQWRLKAREDKVLTAPLL